MKTLFTALAAIALVSCSVPLLTPCQSEDGTMCHWDASERGNRHGASYIAFTEEVRVYLPR